MCKGGVVGVDNVVVKGWYRSVRMELVVLMVECAVVVIMKDNGWEMVEDVVDVVVFVELWVGGLASNSSSIENVFVLCISSWELTSRSGLRRSVSDSPPLSEIMSFSKNQEIMSFCSVSLSILVAHDLWNIKVNHFAVNVHLVDSVRVCVCMLCMYACWVVCRRWCNYVWIFGVCWLTLIFLKTVEE